MIGSWFIKLLFSFFIFLSFTSCTDQLITETESSGYSSLNNSDLTTRWNVNKFPLNLKYDENFAQDEVDAAVNAAYSWEEAADNVVSFMDVSESTSLPSYSSLSRYDDNTFAIYKIENWPSDLPTTALAVTQIFGDKKNTSSGTVIEVDHADILVNYDMYTFVTDGSWGYDLESILLHEMGHFLGLKHNTKSSSVSVMYPSISKYDIAQTPKSQDVEDLFELYPDLATRSIASVEQEEEEVVLGRVIIQLEIFPNGLEKMKIIEGEKTYEVLTSCNHNH